MFSLSLSLSLSRSFSALNITLFYIIVGDRSACRQSAGVQPRGVRDRSLTRKRSNRRGAYPEGPPGGTTECLSGSADPRAAGGGGVGGEGGRGSGGGRCQERRGARKGPCRTQHRRRSSSTDKYVVPQRRQATHGHGRYQTVSLESCFMKTAPSPRRASPFYCASISTSCDSIRCRVVAAHVRASRNRDAPPRRARPPCARACMRVCSYKVLRADRPRSRTLSPVRLTRKVLAFSYRVPY